MRHLFTILALVFSCNLFAQSLKIETKFVLLGMINDQGITKKGDCKYHIDSYLKEDSTQFKSFIHITKQFFHENSTAPDLEIKTDKYGNKTISSKFLAQELKELFIIKAGYYKFHNPIFLKKRLTQKCGDKRQKYFIRTSNYKRLKTWEEKLSFLKGAFLRNGSFYNDTVEFSYLKDYYYFHPSQKSNPEIILNILKPYKDELMNIEFIENIYPLQTIVTIRLFKYLVDYEKLKKRAVKPIPNTIVPYRPNPMEYLGIE